MTSKDLDAKESLLRNTFKDMGSVLVAYSGGVDSTLLLKVAHDTLGEQALAAVVKSQVHPESEWEEACEHARTMGAELVTIEADVLGIPELSENHPERCYQCKKTIFRRLKGLASEHNLEWVVDGANADDLDQHRPGLRAARELRVRSPLAEAGLSKAEVRQLSKKLQLTTWDKPAQACLATRIPYGESVTEDRLRLIDRAETYLKGLGFGQIRVRYHGSVARIEAEKSETERLASGTMRERIVSKLKELGFRYVTLDLEGYRSGSMDEVL